jgi:hypothetical protein
MRAAPAGVRKGVNAGRCDRQCASISGRSSQETALPFSPLNISTAQRPLEPRSWEVGVWPPRGVRERGVQP